MPDVNYFAERVKWWCLDANLGYDQSQRDNFYDGGEVDCSSLVINVLAECGFSTGGCTYTGNMRAALTGVGWDDLPGNTTPEKGDILLNERDHVAVCVGPNQLAQASYDENGNITGGRTGDQTGRETNVSPYYSYPWDCVLRYNPQPIQDPQPQQTKEENMRIITRVGDNKKFLVVNLSMIEITDEQYYILGKLNVDEYILQAAEVQALMQLTHLTAADAVNTASVYGTLKVS